MCFTEKFCVCVPLGLGCLILGVISFIIAAFLTVSSITLLIMEQNCPGCGGQYLEHFPQLVMNKTSINIILATVTLLGVIWMVVSVLFVFGIKKNNSTYVLCYFSFGIMLTIICMLSALLVLLEGHWELALAKIIVSIFYMHCLVVVYTAYDLMQNGTVLKFSQRRLSDEAMLILDS